MNKNHSKGRKNHGIPKQLLSKCSSWHLPVKNFCLRPRWSGKHYFSPLWRWSLIAHVTLSVARLWYRPGVTSGAFCRLGHSFSVCLWVNVSAARQEIQAFRSWGDNRLKVSLLQQYALIETDFTLHTHIGIEMRNMEAIGALKNNLNACINASTMYRSEKK